MLTLQAQSLIHCGSGEDMGYVDQVIQRDVATGIPKIEGATLKGAIRNHTNNLNGITDNFIDNFFGPDSCSTRSKCSFSDAKLLLFPMEARKNIFAYITCPTVLYKWLEDAEDLRFCDTTRGNLTQLKNVLKNEKRNALENTVADKDFLLFSTLKNKAKPIYLDKFIVDVRYSPLTEKFAGTLEKACNIENIAKRIVIVPDSDFCYMVNHGLEILTRTKIDPGKGTVEKGMLFTEEYLPCESIFYSCYRYKGFERHKFSNAELFVENNPNEDHFFEYHEKHSSCNFDKDYEKFEQELAEVENFKQKLQEKTLHIGGKSNLGRSIFNLRWVL